MVAVDGVYYSGSVCIANDSNGIKKIRFLRAYKDSLNWSFKRRLKSDSQSNLIDCAHKGWFLFLSELCLNNADTCGQSVWLCTQCNAYIIYSSKQDK